MSTSAPLPAGPQAQSWTSGGKDFVTTALTGHVWVTAGRGIVNEVYWPAADQPQIKDLGFLVIGPQGWREVKRVSDYEIRAAADLMVPLPTIVQTGEFYRLSLTVTPDPERAAVLIGYELIGIGPGEQQKLRLLPLLAPHLGRSTLTPDDKMPGLGADTSPGSRMGVSCSPVTVRGNGLLPWWRRMGSRGAGQVMSASLTAGLICLSTDR